MRRRAYLQALTASSVLGIAGCSGDDGEAPTEPVLSMSSAAVPAGGTIPVAFTCDGVDESPPLSFSAVPMDAASLAVVVDDPDAGPEPFTHWILWNLPPDVGMIPRGIPRTETVESLRGAKQGSNDFGSIGYRGPCPPPADRAHTYRFRAFAFAEQLELEAGADAAAFTEAYSGLIVGTGGFLSEYDRGSGMG